jgi:hypothetical protein
MPVQSDGGGNANEMTSASFPSSLAACSTWRNLTAQDPSPQINQTVFYQRTNSTDLFRRYMLLATPPLTTT